ncbi:GIY-YIG nuclease family protein [Robertmurraya andreesenii]|uniref:Uri superfamily endonuclease n=1 Tax=Anoxybacillus andreesenii TaxID=1325932 RepID=A0ABT9V2G3_9BACL|nr:GIY-YIG nuclease family protein [Robertmurraya andreesenii]MDQ0155116.1 Uri superfamily endonuclease [Robertmurraya andreesenii]
MIEVIDPSHTLYAIYLEVPNAATVKVGKLGVYFFQKGMYIYVGSAKRNILARIDRHKRVDKRLKWHFDYLRPYGTITRIITYEGTIGECVLAEKIRKEVGGSLPVKRFGSSDCRCPSHLIYFS